MWLVSTCLRPEGIPGSSGIFVDFGMKRGGMTKNVSFSLVKRTPFPVGLAAGGGADFAVDECRAGRFRIREEEEGGVVVEEGLGCDLPVAHGRWRDCLAAARAARSEGIAALRCWVILAICNKERR